MLQKLIPSYLYFEYSDDEDLQAFVRSFNELAQEYVDWFNTINLPIYTQQQIQSYLLDWVAEGLYGIVRSTIGLFKDIHYGTYNSWQFNTVSYNAFTKLTPYTLSDDVFKRVITWHFYKGDGKVFNLVWLKRRIERFLFGSNGSDYLGATYRVSVSFLDPSTVVIRIINQVISSAMGMLYGKFNFNPLGYPFNKANFTVQNLPKIPLAEVLKIAIDARILELPFQFDYIVLN